MDKEKVKTFNQELIKVIQENPSLEIMVNIPDDICTGEWGSYLANASSVEVVKFTHVGERYVDDEDDIEACDFCCLEECVSYNSPCPYLDKRLDEIKANIEWTEAIMIYVSPR